MGQPSRDEVFGQLGAKPGGVAKNEGRHQRSRLGATVHNSLSQSLANPFHEPKARRGRPDDDW
jgi:hypothetical protein